MIEIPGDLLEGGGQIVRTSLALSALVGKEVKITKIREKRPNPGLQPQHVTSVRALAAICNAETEGIQQGSREIIFRPHGHASGSFSFDVGTAGSIPLILQALMPSSPYAKEQVVFDLTGGTDVKWSPTIDYVRLAVLPTLRLMGYEAAIELQRRGHYPKGGGRIRMTIQPVSALRGIDLTESPSVTAIEGISHCVKLPSHVAQRQAAAAKERLAKAGRSTVSIAIETYPSDRDDHLGPGSGITLTTKSAAGSVIAADALGERGKPAERVGEEAAAKLLEELSTGTPVDCHMADILIPYVTVAKGTSKIRTSQITMHALTNIKVAELLTSAKFEVVGELGKTGLITVQGIGMTS